MGRGVLQISQRLILVTIVGSIPTCHAGDQGTFCRQGAAVPNLGFDRPGGTVFPQLRCRVDEKGEERFSLKRHSWQAGLYTVGASISA